MLLTLSFIHRTANAAQSDSERNTVTKVHELVLRRLETSATREDIATQYDTKKGGQRPPFL